MKREFEELYNNCHITFYSIRNENIEVGFSNLGGAIEYLRIKMPDGSWRDVCLRYRWPTDRVASDTYSGAVIGRVANRIAGGKFTLNGTTYSLTKNDGENTLHGGSNGFDKQFFNPVPHSKSDLEMIITSLDGDQGFPGTLTMRVEYVLDGLSLTVRFSAVSDKATAWAPTIHPYFHFGDEKTIEETYLQIYADSYTPMDRHQIPTGEILSVEGTPFDFRKPKKIGTDLRHELLDATNGYDHNYALRGNHAATVYHEKSGIRMDISTDMPGLHFYSGNFLKGNAGTHELSPREGFALEPQFFPNAVNTPNFIQPFLRQGEAKTHFIRYDFGFVETGSK